MANKKTSSEPISGVTGVDKSKAEKVHSALYQIADAASAMMDMQEFYAVLHRIMRGLMYAENFYVSLYDPVTHIISAPYFADEAGDTAPGPSRLEDYARTLRAHVLRTGKTLHVSGEEIEEGKRMGIFEPMGTPAEDWIGVPLKVGEQVIGSLTIQSYQKGIRYDGQDVKLLEFIAQHIAVALTRARTIDETRQRNAELQIINSVQEGLASRLDVQSIYELVGEKIRDTFNAQIVNISTYDRAANLMVGRYFFEAGQTLPRLTLPPFGFRKYVVERGEPLVVNEDMSHWMEVYENPVLHGVQPKSAIFVPMMVGDDVIGVISLQNIDQENAFSEADLRLLTTLANSMSVALENARLFEETQRLLKETEQRNAELAVINSIQAGLASKLEMQAIYNLIGEKIRNIFKAETVGINQYDQEHDLISTPYLWSQGKRLSNEEPTPLFDSPLRKLMIDSRKSWFINRDSKNITEALHTSPDEQLARWPKSGISTPIIASDKVIGLIQILNMEQENTFTDADLHLLETISNSMSIALENARLWEQEKLYRKALERELEIGREIQTGFLPETLPLAEGWEIAAVLMSAREVAGDFYDAFELPDGTIGLVIADVCDKGVGAALFMTLFRSLVRVIANQDYFEQTGVVNLVPTTGERLRHTILLTNNYIADTHGTSGMFATLFFGILDPRDGKLSYINGGHEPPLIVRSGQVYETLRKTGPAVGVIPNGHFELLETCLQTGDTFFAFTDGVPDCTDLHGIFFGRDRLHEILSRSSASAHELVSTIETELRQYIGSANQFDDITLLAVRRA